MTQAKDIAKNLRKFMNQHNYTASDLRRGLIPILNGKMEYSAPTLTPTSPRKHHLEAAGPSCAESSVFIEDQESCFT